MTTPTLHQLECWCAIHRIQIEDRDHRCILCAYTNIGAVVDRVSVSQATWSENFRDACEEIARNLCLVSPQRALNL